MLISIIFLIIWIYSITVKNDPYILYIASLFKTDSESLDSAPITEIESTVGINPKYEEIMRKILKATISVSDGMIHEVISGFEFA